MQLAYSCDLKGTNFKTIYAGFNEISVLSVSKTFQMIKKCGLDILLRNAADNVTRAKLPRAIRSKLINCKRVGFYLSIKYNSLKSSSNQIALTLCR